MFTKPLVMLCLLLAIIGASSADTAYIADSDRDRKTLRNELQLETDGSYHYNYETSNGIAANELGLGGVAVQGGSSYTAPDGSLISVRYVADDKGYHAVGDHIPKVPDYILRALEYIRKHPYQVRDYYTGELKTVAHDSEAFKVYTRNIDEATTPRGAQPRPTPEVVHLTHAPPLAVRTVKAPQ